MMLTRDSAIWWLGLAAATLGYLITAEKPPTDWTYMQWLQASSFLLAWIVGKLATSPLAGAPKADTVRVPKVPTWLVAAALAPALAALSVAGCGPKTKPTLVKVDSAVYQSLKALHQTAVVLGTSQVITPAQELKIQEAILPVTILGEQATRVIVAWKSGPTPPELHRLVQEMGTLAQKIIAIVPQNAEAKAALLEKVAMVQQAIATVLLIMSTRGAA
jgi:hypothetical protein